VNWRGVVCLVGLIVLASVLGVGRFYVAVLLVSPAGVARVLAVQRHGLGAHTSVGVLGEEPLGADRPIVLRVRSTGPPLAAAGPRPTASALGVPPPDREGRTIHAHVTQAL
jgi:hypothetical protein